LKTKSILVTTAAILLTALSVSQSHAAKCYWTNCNHGCLDDAVAMGTQMRPRSNKTTNLCRQTWCCHKKLGKKLQKDDGYMCRVKCGSKPSGAPYFKCMNKCLGR
jgi:hypothetical protein